MSRNSKGIDNVTKNVIKVSMRLIIYALMILVMIKGATMAYSFGHGIFYAASVEPPPGRDIEVSIPENISTASAADMLKQKGLIVSKFSFEVQAKFFEYKIKPGNYILNTSQTSRQILDILNVGPEEKKETAPGPEGQQANGSTETKVEQLPTPEAAETLTPSPEGQDVPEGAAHAETSAKKTKSGTKAAQKKKESQTGKTSQKAESTSKASQKSEGTSKASQKSEGSSNSKTKSTEAAKTSAAQKASEKKSVKKSNKKSNTTTSKKAGN
ncbi:hypothetical protein [Johnsonella ignava]|jgi:aminodeoxychorismate lyase|uniref:hypothetical protein n=1 Tax=Johnsonella ignava TaxID=43995 RepID=UPI0023F51193|nr:hypothetical protein [Johnsonella ignava]